MRIFAVAFVLGAFVLQHEESLPLRHVALAGHALLLAASLLSLKAHTARMAVLLAAGALAGYGWAAWRAESRLADALPHALEGRDVEIVGVVASLPQAAERSTRFVLHRESGDGVPRVLQLAWYAPAPALAAGQRWRLTVRLKRPRGLANPHAFDFERWALERGIRAAGYVRAQPAAMLLEARTEGWPHSLHRWRGEIRDRMKAQLGEAPWGGVLVALAIGDQDAIAPRDWQAFWRTGVGHLMSISGLHITMLGALAYALARAAWLRVPAAALRVPAPKAAIVAGLLAALAYSLVSGYQVPAQRTFCMLAAMAVCVLLDRHGSPSRVLAVAALAVVGLDPWAVLSGGFWLSFGAVAAIFYVMALRTGSRGRVALAAREQLAVTVAMAPMLAALFGELPLVSPLANAIAIPLVGLVVVPLTLAGAFSGWAPPLEAAHTLLAAAMPGLEWLAGLPGAVIETHAPAPWTLVAALAGCAWLLAPRGVPLRACGALWIAPLFLVTPQPPAPGEAWIDVLDVGSGLAVVVRTTATAIAYDAGPGWNPDADTGSRTVVPFLRGEGVQRLDGVVISHADDDHAGGALSLAVAREPRWLLSTLAPEDPLHFVVERSIPCMAGLAWRADGVDFSVLHPIADTRARKENDRSCVVRVATAGASMLLTGDIEARAEAELLARGREALRSDVLLVPHHGSRTSSTPAFVEAVAPRLAVVSTGYRNRFGHPHASVVVRYAQRGAAIRRTDEEGAIRLVLPAEAGRAIGFSSAAQRVRYWSDRRSRHEPFDHPPPIDRPAGRLRRRAPQRHARARRRPAADAAHDRGAVLPAGVPRGRGRGPHARARTRRPRRGHAAARQRPRARPQRQAAGRRARGDLAVRCARAVPPCRRAGGRPGVPGLRRRDHRRRGPLRVRDDKTRALSRPHAAHPLHGARGPAPPAHLADVHRGRAAQRARRALPPPRPRCPPGHPQAHGRRRHAVGRARPRPGMSHIAAVHST